jgi:hypothetical protein
MHLTILSTTLTLTLFLMTKPVVAHPDVAAKPLPCCLEFMRKDCAQNENCFGMRDKDAYYCGEGDAPNEIYGGGFCVPCKRCAVEPTPF